jgi:glycosyltransferase involved in cell wall biosynthesis
MNRPLVSICIPTYRRPDGLEAAIASVLDQDVEDVEIVVADNHTDGQAVVERFGDPRIRYVRNGSNVGPTRNACAALDRARGRLLGVLHDDDRFLPGYLAAVLRPFEQESALGVVFTDHYFDVDGRLRERGCDLAGGTYPDFLEPLLRHMPVAISATLMRREVWTASRPLPDLLTMVYVLYVRAALGGWSFRYVDRPLMVYRVHPGQASNAGARLCRDVVSLWELFTFEDERCESLRCRRLALALVERAASALQTGRDEEAARDVARAVALDASVLTPKARVVRWLAGSRPRAALGRALLRQRDRVRTRRRQ